MEDWKQVAKSLFDLLAGIEFNAQATFSGDDPLKLKRSAVEISKKRHNFVDRYSDQFSIKAT
jgi:hypothetical protein